MRLQWRWAISSEVNLFLQSKFNLLKIQIDMQSKFNLQKKGKIPFAKLLLTAKDLGIGDHGVDICHIASRILTGKF